MKLKIKRIHDAAVLPKRAHDTDSGFDIVAIDGGTRKGSCLIYRTGLVLEPQSGYDIRIYPRGSIIKYDLTLANSVGVIDQDYRGELLICFRDLYNKTQAYILKNYEGPRYYQAGDKVAQLIVHKLEETILEEVSEVSETVRNDGRFGSTGT